MAIRSKQLAAGVGWWMGAFTCDSGPHDPVFEERHEAMSIAVNTHGTFQYRTATGRAVMTPGAILLGNAGQCFECGHEHGVGDHCVALHLDGACWQEVVAATPGARKASFSIPALPPLRELLPHVARLQALQAGATDDAEEIALCFAGAVLAAQQGAICDRRTVRARDERRISECVRRIERDLDESLSLQRLAAETAMSRFHFLRTFTHVVGITPHQFVQRARLRRAAARLHTSDATIAAIALEAGFNDLSAFHAGFRRAMGASPDAYRKSLRGERKA